MNTLILPGCSLVDITSGNDGLRVLDLPDVLRPTGSARISRRAVVIAPGGGRGYPSRGTIMSLKVAAGHLARGDWENAHAIVQYDESALGCWAHGM